MKNIDIDPGPAIPISTAVPVTGTIHPITDIIPMDGGIIINLNAGY
jgi:hypothetical protein